MRHSLCKLLLTGGLCAASGVHAQQFAWDARFIRAPEGRLVDAGHLDDSGRVVGNYLVPGSGLNQGFFFDTNGRVELFGRPGDPALASRMNARGEIIGTRIGSDGDPRPYIYRNGSWTALVAPNEMPQHSGAHVGAFNDAGQVVLNYRTPPGLYQPYHTSLVQPNGRYIDVGHLGGEYTVGMNINNAGQVVGHSNLPRDADNSFGPTHAFVYQHGVMTDLGTLGGSYSTAADNNDRGQVLGDAYTSPFESHAFLWENGVMRDLGTLGGGRTLSSDLNERGEAVGDSAPDPRVSNDFGHAYLYSDGRMQDLHPLLGGDDSAQSSAIHINDRGQVLAWSWMREPGGQHVSHIFFYENGQAIDLGTYLQDSFGATVRINPAGMVLNNLGQILLQVSFASDESAYYPLLLTPVPEPAAAVLLLAGGLALLVMRGRRRSTGLVAPETSPHKPGCFA